MTLRWSFPVIPLCAALLLALGTPALADPGGSSSPSEGGATSAAPSPSVADGTSSPTATATASPSPTSPDATTPGPAPQTGVVTGRVIDDETGGLVPWAAVSLTKNGRNTDGPVMATELTGRYALSVTPGTWWLQTSMDARAEFWPYVDRWKGRPAPWGNAIEVDVVAGETTTVDIVFYRGCRIEGVVVDRDGARVTSISEMRVESLERSEILGWARAGSDGSYVIYAGGGYTTTRAHVVAAVVGLEGYFVSRELTIHPDMVISGVTVAPEVVSPPSTGGQGGNAEEQGGLPRSGDAGSGIEAAIGLLLVLAGVALVARRPAGRRPA